MKTIKRADSGVEVKLTRTENFCLFYDGQWSSKRIAGYLDRYVDSYKDLAILVRDCLELIKTYYSDDISEDGLSYKNAAMMDFYPLIEDIVNHLYDDDAAEKLWLWIEENPNFILSNKDLFRSAIIEGKNKNFPFETENLDLQEIFSGKD